MFAKNIFMMNKKLNTAILIGQFFLSIAIFLGIYFFIFQPSDTPIFLGVSKINILRFDRLSTTVFLMVAIIGLVILKFSKTYLQGEKNHLGFIKKLLFTIFFVELLVLSGNLCTLFIGWVATSFGLQKLIIFYKNRKAARRAVRKKHFVARMSDIFLFIAFSLLYCQLHTADLETIFQHLETVSNSGNVPIYIHLSAIFLVIAALIKSVQIPFHGWLLEVMETPTPVSGLLHAGLLNAGPFLIIRFAFLMEVAQPAATILLIFAGVSALYGTLVFPKQHSIKISLAYSSIGHMGFSLMLCGMGFYVASLLHLVAHSFYKAHSFLSTGSAIDKSRLNDLKKNAKPTINIWQMFLSLLITSSLFFLIFNYIPFVKSHGLNFQMGIVSLIVIVGVASFMAKILAFSNGFANILKSILLSLAVLCSFFVLENATTVLLGTIIPSVSQPTVFTKMICILLVVIFVTVIFATTFKLITNYKWQIYQRNGFYVHLIFDRFMNAFYKNQKDKF